MTALSIYPYFGTKTYTKSKLNNEIIPKLQEIFFFSYTKVNKKMQIRTAAKENWLLQTFTILNI